MDPAAKSRSIFLIVLGSLTGLVAGAGGVFLYQQFQERTGAGPQQAVQQIPVPVPSEKPLRMEPPQPPAEPDEAPAVEPEGEERRERREWLFSRPGPRPILAYLFSGGENSLKPLAAQLEGPFAEMEDLVLSLSGHVYLSPAGAVFLDGGRLLSQRAGEIIGGRLSRAGEFSIEALVTPVDKEHRGPARIVSLSYDGSKRNLTLAQEGSYWVFRLRTTQTGGNGTNPEIRVPGLEPCLTHVVVTWQGGTERIYLNGEEALVSDEVKGDFTNWAAGFPLVLGNEAYEARDWSGVIRFVAFYSGVLSGEEAVALAGSLPEGDPPLGYAPEPAPEPVPLPQDLQQQPEVKEDVGIF